MCKSQNEGMSLTYIFTVHHPPLLPPLPPLTPSLSPAVAVEIRRLRGDMGVDPRAREDLLLVRQLLSQLMTSTVCNGGCIYRMCEMS